MSVFATFIDSFFYSFRLQQQRHNTSKDKLLKSSSEGHTVSSMIGDHLNIDDDDDDDDLDDMDIDDCRSSASSPVSCNGQLDLAQPTR